MRTDATARADLPAWLGRWLDSILGGVVQLLAGLSSSPAARVVPGPTHPVVPDGTPPRPATPLPDGGNLARPSPIAAATPSVASLPGPSTPRGRPASERGDLDATDLGDDTAKLVRYTLVSVRRERERILSGSDEILICGPSSVDALLAIVVGRVVDARGATLTEADRRSLRLHFRVLERWQRPSLEFEARQLSVLARIAAATQAPEEPAR